MLDLGLNIGVFTILFLEMGCHVVAFEPLPPNLHRALESVRANGLQDRFTVLNNAVSNKEAPLYISLNTINPGSSRAVDVPEGGAGEVCVMSLTIDGLFAWEGRPLSPTTGKPMEPWEVGFVKVDIEGHDASAYAGMQRVLADGHPIPLLTMEYSQPMEKLNSGCFADGVLHMLDDMGYSFWDHNDTPLDSQALLAAADATSERLPKEQRTGMAPAYEMWMQHSSVDAGWGLRATKHNLKYEQAAAAGAEAKK